MTFKIKNSIVLYINFSIQFGLSRVLLNSNNYFKYANDKENNENER